MIATTAALPDQFIPLQAPANLPSAGFSPLKTGSLPQPANQPSAQATPARLATSAADSNPCGEPVVTLERNGDVVSRIRVQCGCGRVIELDCAY